MTQEERYKHYYNEGYIIDECFEFADEHPVSDLENTEGASLDALFDGDPVKEIDDIIDNLQQR